MLDDLIAAYGNRFLVAALGVSLALLCLFIVLWILRNRAPSPFVRGGRNRQPRLQVLDAAAVDTRRRIVLIRRDNVEHLVMIGGPTDIVIESGIGDERAYLSARAVSEQPIEEQPELAGPVVSEALAPAEPKAPLIAAAAPATMPVGAAARPPLAKEAPRTEPTQPVAIKVSVVPPAVERHPPQPASARPPGPSIERPAAAVTAPVMAATASLATATTAPEVVAAHPAPEVRTETPSSAAASPPETRIDAPKLEAPTPPERPPAQPAGSLEPVLTAKADTAHSDPALPTRHEPEFLQPVPAIGPAMTAGSQPVGTLPPEPVQPVLTDEIAPPTRFDDVRDAVSNISTPAAEPTAVPLIDTPAAEDVLEAARLRVLAQTSPMVAPETQHTVPAEPPVKTATPVSQEPANRDVSEFERVLEEEMALHLASDPAPAARSEQFTSPILPETRADRPRPPMTAVLPEGNRSQTPSQTPQPQGQEPNLQTEIARIFGEMSASRNP